ncbi:lipopolysaccharide biosynthesis protein [Marinicrinis lubricantis]|uniref:Lipopolysaccharide biosynthesis protein n=1 Tax=Marinicrinis lubricantis TaxID=2086470 RepID=A0ABW1IJV5_9BACL
MASTILRTSVSNMMVLVLTTLTSILSARMFGVVGKGELAAIIFWPTFISGMVGLGLPTSLIYNIGKTREKASGFLNVAIYSIVPTGIMMGIVAWFGIPMWLSGYSQQVIEMTTWYTVVTLPMLLLINILLAAAQSMNQFHIYNRLRMLVPLMNVVGLIVIWSIEIVDLLYAVIVYVISNVISMVWAAIGLHKHLKYRWNTPRRDKGIFKSLFGYGSKAYGVELIGTLYTQFDKLIIMSLLTPRDFGLYSVVYALSRIYNTVQNAVTSVVFPKVSGLTKDKIVKIVSRAFRISTVLMIVIVVPSMVIGKHLLGILYGEEFLEAGSTFYILAVECILGGSSWILASSFNAYGKPGLVLIRQIIALTVTIVFMLILTPIMGLNGIALALLGGSIIRLIISIIAMSLLFKVPVRQIVYDKQDIHYIKHQMRKKLLSKGVSGDEKPAKSSSHG